MKEPLRVFMLSLPGIFFEASCSAVIQPRVAQVPWVMPCGQLSPLASVSSLQSLVNCRGGSDTCLGPR